MEASEVEGRIARPVSKERKVSSVAASVRAKRGQSCLSWKAGLPGRPPMKRPRSKDQPPKECQCEATGLLSRWSFYPDTAGSVLCVP